MSSHPLQQVIEAADQAISTRDFDTLMDFYADDAILVIRPGMNAIGKGAIRQAFVMISAHFDHSLVVRPGDMVVLEGGHDTALAVMETILEFPAEAGVTTTVTRRATYVFRKDVDDRWRCLIDNSYGTALLEDGAHA